MLVTLFNEFKSSIKSPDTEEKLDLVLYRPMGFAIAKISKFFFLTPSMLSLMGLFSGILAAYYYLDFENSRAMIIGSLYFVLSGIFDSADGQLARIANQSSKLGLILDGICDSIVIISIYATCSWPFLKLYGIAFVPVVCAGLYLHSCQCAILDFYHREYLYFGYGKIADETYWNPDIQDGRRLVINSRSFVERTMNSLRLTWIKKQQFMTSRKIADRNRLREMILSSSKDLEKKEKIMLIYKKYNLGLLPFWRLVGVNAHTALMIVAMFIGRFDYYIVAIDLILFNVVIVIVGQMQKKADVLMFAELSRL